MKLKSYFSGTVEAALELARKELGEEAMLVNARPSTPETRHLGAYEIVFGVAPRAAAVSSPPSSPPPPPLQPDLEQLARDITALKRQIQTLSHAVAHSSAPSGEVLPAEAPVLTIDSKIDSQIDPKTDPSLDPALAQAVALGTPLEDLFETSATLGRSGASRAVVMLVGPPGVGKTTTLVKLAGRYGLATRRRTHIVSTDVYRIAAADQLRALAAILGIGCDVVETLGALAQALAEHAEKDLVLIDTPGLSINEIDDGLDLARFASSNPEIDTHLVLSASMKPADLTRMVDAYALFRPAKLLFTRIDETADYGALVSEASRRGLPISFLTTGQKIPDDIEPASRRRLAALIEGRVEGRAESEEPALSIGASA